MSADIQFGEVEEHGPTPGIRPDEDAAFAITPVGQISPDDLLIFVDLDVMRDMEAHALSNTSVELGGVMLGQQHVDSEGRPFVVVSDCLRAEHYEATKGSFKFTHDTWSQITNQREEFRPDLEMVGWYHTHPGWTVFLSGMDLFICNNFFNRDLDVALVIDPCEQDRGWFQWTTASGGSAARKKTRATTGFLLTSNRYRREELEHFASIYSKEPKMNFDPRYSAGTTGGVAGQPVVNIMEKSQQRSPISDFAILVMLGMQFLFLGLIAWKLIAPPASQNEAEKTEQIERIDSYIGELKATREAQIRDETTRSMLQTIVSAQSGPNDLVEKFAAAQEASLRAIDGVDAQRALVREKTRQLTAVNKEYENEATTSAELKSALAFAKDANKSLNKEVAELKKAKESAGGDESGDGTGSWLPLLYSCLGGLTLAALGFWGGRWQMRRSMSDEFDGYYDDQLASVEQEVAEKRLDNDESANNDSEDETDDRPPRRRRRR